MRMAKATVTQNLATPDSNFPSRAGPPRELLSRPVPVRGSHDVTPRHV